MDISVKHLRFDQNTMWISLSDDRTIQVPLNWFPRLMKATPAERKNYTFTDHGLHWEALDEDISIEALLAGKGDQTKTDDQAE